MKGFPIVEAGSRRGQTVINAIAGRAATVLDPKALAVAA